MRITKILLCGACLAIGCAQASIQRDGFVLERDKTEELLATLLRRASFDLECPAPEIRCTVLAVHDDAGPDMPKQVGVVGCNKRATYTMEFISTTMGGWGGRGGWGFPYTHETGWRLDAAGVEDTE